MSVLREGILKAEGQAWHDVHALCGSLSEPEWARPGVTGDWTPKDVLAHLSCWAAEAARQLECIRSGEPAKGPEVEAFNQASYEACRDLTVHEVLAMFSAAHHRLREELEQVAPVALSGKIVEMIHECADRHYREHLAHLTAFVEGTKA